LIFIGSPAPVGSTGPFVGLPGTPMGVGNAFSGMPTGGGGIGAISAGIAEALITTAIGLGAALPAVWLYNYFINRIDYISMETTMASKEFMDFLLRYEARLHRKAGTTVTGDTEAARMVGSGSTATGGSGGRH
jgi:biopolymer transport protein ExbB/biopolymer transport protein TolQ